MIKNLVYQMNCKAFYIYIYQRIYIIIQDIFWSIYKEYYLDLIYIRRNYLQQRQNDWICFGPNYFWFIDNYCKFISYNFEIYINIDIYSKFIL